jgi:hypothetical protein
MTPAAVLRLSAMERVASPSPGAVHESFLPRKPAAGGPGDLGGIEWPGPSRQSLSSIVSRAGLPRHMRDALREMDLGVLKSEMRNICSVFLLLVEMGTTDHFRPWLLKY